MEFIAEYLKAGDAEKLNFTELWFNLPETNPPTSSFEIEGHGTFVMLGYLRSPSPVQATLPIPETVLRIPKSSRYPNKSPRAGESKWARLHKSARAGR